MRHPPLHLGGPPLVAWACTDCDGELLGSEFPEAEFPACSTIKLVVMVEVFRRFDRGTLDRKSEVVVVSEFASALDGLPFRLPEDEVDQELAGAGGRAVAIGDLVERMITVSSNDATNLLTGLTGIAPLTQVLADLGASSSRFERPIGDQRAEAGGLSNWVTPLDLCRVLAQIVSGRAASPSSCLEMLEILGRQRDRAGIPAGLPDAVRVANKTGWDPGLRHDAAVVWPAAAPAYCLAICTSGFDSEEAANLELRGRSQAFYQVVAKPQGSPAAGPASAAAAAPRRRRGGRRR